MTISEPSGRLTRWRLLLAEFNFQIKYKKGADNHHADALSRLLIASPTVDHGDDDYFPTFLMASDEDATPTDTAELGQRDDDFVEVEYEPYDELLATIETTERDTHFNQITPEEFKVAQHHDTSCADVCCPLEEGVGLPFRVDSTGILIRTAEAGPKIVVRHSLTKQVVYLNHYRILAGHPGGRKSYYRIRKHFYCPTLAVDCYVTVRNCPECTRMRIKRRQNIGQLKLFPAGEPLESVCIDILGPLIRTARGHEYLMVISDRFTKLTRMIPMRGISAPAVERAFVDSWVFTYGPPLDLLADNGRQFTSKFFQGVCDALNIHNSFTTTYHPQTNGQVECFNRSIASSLKAYVADHPRDWDLSTSSLTYAYNFQPHSSPTPAPFELVLSKPPGPLELKDEPRETGQTPRKYHEKCTDTLVDALKTARTKMKLAQDRYKRNYDKRLRRDNQRIAAGYHM